MDALQKIVEHMQKVEAGGALTLVLDEAGDWSASYVFGQEAEDSPMAGGAAYGYGPTADLTLGAIARDCGLLTTEEHGAYLRRLTNALIGRFLEHRRIAQLMRKT